MVCACWAALRGRMIAWLLARVERVLSTSHGYFKVLMPCLVRGADQNGANAKRSIRAGGTSRRP